MKRLIWLLLLCCLPAQATISFTQFAAHAGSGSSPYSLTVSSTGSGHLLFVQGYYSAGSTEFITSVSGGGTWVIPSSCQQGYSAIGAANSCAYVLSSSSGTTSVSIGFSGTSTTWAFAFYEVSTSLTGFSLDAIATSTYSTSNTAPAGQALTLTGSEDVIIQQIQCDTSFPTSTYINESYNYEQVQSAQPFGSAYLLNTTTGTAPAWVWNANSGGCAVGAASFTDEPAVSGTGQVGVFVVQ